MAARRCRPDVQGFGRCLLHAVQAMLAQGHSGGLRAQLRQPTLPTRLLVEAAEMLLAAGDRAVLGAADDGGYYLLGLKAAHAAMFAEIAWSTATRGRSETRDRARGLGLDLIELDPWYDVDDAAIARRAHERGARLRRAPRDTAPAIERLGL